MEQRRVLLAFLLMGLVLVASQYWYGTRAPVTTEPGTADTTMIVDRAPVEALPPVNVDTEPEPIAPSAPVVTAAAGPPVVVETPLYRISIDRQGGAITEFELLMYPSFTHEGAVRLVPAGARFLERAVDLDGQRLGMDDLTFDADIDRLVVESGAPVAELVLSSGTESGTVTQRYRFDPDSYVIEYALDLGRDVSGVLVTGIGPFLPSNEENTRDDYASQRGVVRIDGDIINMKDKSVRDETLALGGQIDWAGIKSKYFLALLLAGSDGSFSAVTMRGTPADTVPGIRVAIGAPVEGGRSNYRIYFGPQEFNRLSSLGAGLDGVSQYGWSWIRWMIAPFAKLIVMLMLWLYTIIPSYGWVLVVFSILVRVVMWPLTTKSFRSIQAMQRLQPEIARIREQHKEDPQRMQKETMSLYRERKVNPLGGCLPNLIPMPILFALFFVFRSAIELRDQSFLWLPDLSQPDPIFLLPILMGLSMFVSTKLTMTDPKMAAMTYVMPIVLTFVFINLASGLVLYYTLSNVLTFAQQWWLRSSAAAATA